MDAVKPVSENVIAGRVQFGDQFVDGAAHLTDGSLAHAFVRPHDDGVVAVEVAECPPAGLVGSVHPLPLSAPRERVASALVALDEKNWEAL